MKFYTISPQGVPENPHLFPMFRPTFIEKGHSFVNRIEECDVVLFDLHTRIADYKQSDVDWVTLNNPKTATFCEWDRGNLSDEEWPHPLTVQQALVMCRIMGSGVHFCRLLDKTKIDIYRQNIYPYEKCILYEEPMLTADQLFEREFDVVFIANYSPSRQLIAEALQADHKLKIFISIGAKKREFNDFVNWHKRGTLFVSSGAGGYTDERKQNLFSIAGLIQEETDQLLLHPFTNAVNCLKISSNPTKQELDYIRLVCNNKEELYRLYKNNYEFMKTYYSKEYIASNILETIQKHLS
jgi:hypothetical protein